MPIDEFLTARWDEAAAVGEQGPYPRPGGTFTYVELSEYIVIEVDTGWLAADIAAKRAILAHHSTVITPSGKPWCDADEEDWPCTTLRLLAQPYAGHPGFDPAWKVA